MKTTIFLGSAITAFNFLIQSSSAAGFLGGAAKVASLAMTGAEIAAEVSKTKRSDAASQKPVIELTWYENGAAFEVTGVPYDLIQAVQIWNSMPALLKSGVEEQYGKVEITGQDSVYAWDYPETAAELTRDFFSSSPPKYDNPPKYDSPPKYDHSGYN